MLCNNMRELPFFDVKKFLYILHLVHIIYWYVTNLIKSFIADILNIPDFERQRRLEVQRNDKWHQFVDGEVILKQGFVNKRKGLFARKRMLLLTTGPRLVYVDPVQMVKKGEIPWSADLRVEPKNFKIFFVHTVSIFWDFLYCILPLPAQHFFSINNPFEL